MAISRGTPGYTKAVLAMLCAGLATFNALYSTQAILPTFVAELGMDVSHASLLVSAATGALAVCIVPASILSERFGRGTVLITSALAATVLGLVIPLFTEPWLLIALRGLQGVLIAGVPAVAMTWISEEIRPQDVGHAMGIYIAGNTVGGLSGRIIPSALLEVVNWQAAMFISAGVALTMAIGLSVLLPRQQNFRPKQLRLGREVRAMVRHWANPGLALLFASAFVGMGCFVSMYNLIGFRLVEKFGISEAAVGAIFFMYLAGTWTSARAGAMATRWGRGHVMGIAAVLFTLGLPLIAAPNLWVAIAGLFVFTASFFAVHSVASGWVGVTATRDRAEASSMYLFCYYMGSSIIGWVSGLIFAHFGWVAVIGWLCVGGCALVGIALASTMYRRRAALLIDDAPNPRGARA